MWYSTIIYVDIIMLAFIGLVAVYRLLNSLDPWGHCDGWPDVWRAPAGVARSITEGIELIFSIVLIILFIEKFIL